MTNKVLLSMLAAAAVPAGAYADIDVTGTTGINDAEKWTNTGLGGVDYGTGSLLNGKSIVVSGASAGTLKYKVTGLPKATYKLTANGTNLKLSVAGQEIKIDGEEENVTFEAEGSFEVVIGYDAIGSYSLTALTLKLECNFESAKKTLEGLTGTDKSTTISTPLTEINAETADYGEGHNYKTAAGTPDALQSKINALQSKLAELTDEAEAQQDVQKAVDIYKELNGLTGKDTYETQVKAVIAEIIAYNANMDKQNTASANWAANQAYKTTQSAAAENYSKTVAAIKVGEGDVWAATSDAVSKFNAAYAAYQEELAKLDTDEKNMTTGEGAVATAASYLESLQKDADKANTEAKDNIEAYNLINDEKGYIAQINKKYTSLYNNFMGLHGTYGSKKGEELTQLKKTVVDSLSARTEVEAYDKAADDKDLFEEYYGKEGVVGLMDAHWNAVEKEVKAAEAFYTTETSDLAITKGNLTIATTAIEGLQDENNKKEALNNEVKELDRLITTAQEEADNALVNYKNGDETAEYPGTVSIAGNITAIKERIAILNADASTAGSIAEAKAIEKAYNETTDSLTKYETALGIAWNSLKEASDDINAIDDISGVDLQNKYGEAYQGVKKVISDATEANEASLKEDGKDPVSLTTLEYIANGVNEFEKKAAPTANAFKAAANKYNELTKANMRNVELAEKAPQYMLEGNRADLPLVENHTEAIETIKTGIVDAAKLEGQALYNAITKVDLEPKDINEHAVTVENLDQEYKNLVDTIVGNNKQLFEDKAGAYKTLFTATGATATYGPGLGKGYGMTAGDGLIETLAGYNTRFAQLPVVLTTPSIKSSDFSNASDWSKYRSSGFNNVEMGKIGTLTVNNVQSKTDATHTSDMFCAGVSARWDTNYAAWQQKIGTLPVGRYVLKFDVSNPGNSSYQWKDNQGKVTDEYKMESLTYVQVGSTKVFDSKISAKDLKDKTGWNQHTITFDVTDDNQDITLSFGYKNLTNHGTADTPELFFANLKLDAEDYGVSNAVAVSKATYELYNEMVALIGSEDGGLIKACLDNVAAHKAIFQGDSDAKDDALSITGLAKNETLSAYNKLKGDIFGADSWTKSYDSKDKDGKPIVKDEVVAAKPTIEAWCNDNDGDEANRPTNTYKTGEKSQYKDLFTTDALKAINNTIMADYNANKLVATCQSGAIEKLQKKVDDLKDAVKTNADNHEIALKQDQLVSLTKQINGYHKDAVGTEGEEGYEQAIDIESLSAYIERTATEPAKTTWKKKEGRYEEVINKLAAINEAIDDAFVATTVKANEEATNINALGTTYSKLITDVKNNEDYYKEAKEAYSTAYKEIHGDTDNPSLAEWLEANAIDPALKAWENDKHPKYKYTTLEPEMNRIVNAIDDAFAKTTLTSDAERTKITDLEENIANFKSAVELNETNHNKQLGYAETAIAQILQDNQTVKDANYSDKVTFTFTHEENPLLVEGEEPVEMTIEEIQNALQSLQQDDLTQKNNEVYNAYKELRSTDTNPYKEIQDKSKAYVQGVANEYYNAVEKANNETWAAARIDKDGNDIKTKLDDAYKEAVKLYNEVEQTSGMGVLYQAFVSEMLESENDDQVKFKEEFGHSMLQKHYNAIAAIESDAQKKLAGALPADISTAKTEDYKILKETDFEDIAKAVEKALNAVKGKDGATEDGVATYIKKLENAVNTKAKERYEEQRDEKTAYYKEHEGYMRQVAGLASNDANTEWITTALQTADSKLAEAKGYITNGLENNGGAATRKMSLLKINLNAALNTLSEVNIETVKAIASYWDNQYETINGQISEKQADYEAASANALDNDLKEAQADWKNVEDALNNLDDKAKASLQNAEKSTGEIATDIAGYKKTLDQALKDAESAVTKAEGAATKNTENIKDYERLLSNDLTEIEAALADMHATIGKLGMSLEQFNEIKEIKAADEAVNKAKAELAKFNPATPYASYTGISDAKTAIAAVEPAVITAEKAWLKDLLKSIQTDFNNSYAYEEGKDYDKLSEDIQTQSNNLNTAKTIDDLADIEQKLLEIEETIGRSSSSNPDAGTVEELNSIAAAIKAKITKLEAAISNLEETLNKDILRGWSHDEVPSAAGLTERLEEIKAAYATDKQVKGQKSRYEEQLNGLSEQITASNSTVSTIKDAAETETIRRQASNKAHTTAKGEIAAVEAKFNEVSEKIDSYELLTSNYESQKSSINASITAALTALDDAQATYSLPNTTLYDLDAIRTSIRTLSETATLEETSAHKLAAEKAVADAEKDVNAFYHANQKELDEALATIKTDCGKLTATAIMDNADASIDAAQEVIAAAEKLKADAQAGSVLVGDIDQDHEITINDFTRLVDYIIGKDKEKPEAGSLEFMRTDVNGDGKILVGDAVSLLKIINNIDNVTAVRAKVRSTANVENGVEVASGKLNITNSFAMSGVLLDIKGITASSITLAERAMDMKLITNTLEDGTVRVMVISTESKTINGNQGAVLNIPSNAKVISAVISDTTGRDYTLFSNDEATAIDTITNAIKSVGEKIYNVGGQMMNGIKKGINIIVNSDGTSTKTLKK